MKIMCVGDLHEISKREKKEKKQRNHKKEKTIVDRRHPTGCGWRSLGLAGAAPND
jgi:hypothetical protein